MTNIAILFSLALKGQRSTFRGIVDYAAKHGPWFCHFQEGRTGKRMQDFARTGVSGVIVSGVSREAMTSRMPKRVERLSVTLPLPSVNVRRRM